MHNLWMTKGNCKDKYDLFFSEVGGRFMYQEARKLCRTCPVLKECTDEVVSKPYEHYPTGYMAGMTPNQRRLLHGLKATK